jgi:hypothetical protein
MKLSKVSRVTRAEESINSSSVFEGDYQRNLESLYHKYNINCYCLDHDKPVTMHIRKMSLSGTLFLADNPTSPNHHKNCTFYSARKKIETTPDGEQKIKPFELTTQFNEKISFGTHAKISSVNKSKSQPGIAMSLLEKLFVTLISNAFCDYSFGGFVNIKSVVLSIVSNSENAKIKTGELDLVSSIYFGDQGILFAKSKMDRLDLDTCIANEVPVSIWFGLIDEVGDDFIVSGGKKLTCAALYMPHKASGPYLAMGTIIKGSDTDFKQMLLTPVVSKSIVLPVHSELQREKVLELQKWVYGRNRSSQYRFYIQKPLKPIVDFNKAVLADLLVISKDKRSGDKCVLSIASKNLECISSVYDSEAINIKEVDVNTISKYFSDSLTKNTSS